MIPINNRDNHIGVVADALAADFGDSYNAMLVESRDRILAGFLGEVFPDDMNFPTTYTCTNGGTAYFESSPYEIYFSDCQIDEAAYEGQFSIQVGNSNWVSSDGLIVTSSPDTTLQFEGTIIIASKDYYATREVNA